MIKASTCGDCQKIGVGGSCPVRKFNRFPFNRTSVDNNPCDSFEPKRQLSYDELLAYVYELEKRIINLEQVAHNA